MSETGPMNGGASPCNAGPTRLLDPEQIAIQAGRQVPFLRLPQAANVYADRQLRLRELAASHPMRDYLLFIATLAQAQHQTLQNYAPVTVPDGNACDAAAHDVRAPLSAANWPRDPTWRSETRRLLTGLQAGLAAGPARDAVRRVIDADDAFFERQADRLLNGVSLGLDLAVAPLIAAGLQTYWTSMVLQTARAHGVSVFGRTDPANACPSCASLPTASVTRIGADESGFRYLHCSLCATQWHFVRIKCAHCDSTKGLHYKQLESRPGIQVPATGARPGAVKAECCDACGRYLKLVAMEADQNVEPAADDLASVALDLLVSEAGHERAGVNLMLVFGDPEPG